MERESNPMEALCRSGCGFYGNPSTDGLCSVCFKEALKKKQQPPATTPSPVAAPFVPAAPAPAPTPALAPAPAPTPLAAAAPTVPSLAAQPQQHTDSKCPNRNKKKNPIMENDPNKKESKGKRLLKKALRRNSKTSNNSQSSSLEQSLSESRSKNSDKKRQTIEIKDSAPLPTADVADAAGALRLPPDPARADQHHKMVDIKESRNEIFQEPAAPPPDNDDRDKSAKLDSASRSSGAESSKKVLKRKLEEESGAGTSGASTGASDTDADDKDPSKDKKKKNRCAVCRKKVGLTGFECRCGGLFCAVHRYSDKHDCSFDYRELGAQEIRRNNPVVVSQKIHKI